MSIILVREALKGLSRTRALLKYLIFGSLKGKISNEKMVNMAFKAETCLVILAADT